MTELNDWNREIIDEFRASGGMVLQGMPLLLLHHVGAKSGIERVNPLAYRALGDAFVIFASKAGAPTHPDWFHNLRAHPHVTIETGTEELAVTARVVSGEQRSQIWIPQTAEFPIFAEYEEAAGREIPVVVLERT